MLIRSIGILLFLVGAASSSFAIHPEKKYIDTPAAGQMQYDSLNILTSDHFRLTGWYCKAPIDTSQILIVLAGGDAGNMSYDLPLAQFLISNFQVPVLLFDYRGFGSSQDFPCEPTAIGHPEYLTDFDAAVAFAEQQYPRRRVILYGRSLGGALAIVEACRKTGLTGVIAESPYVSQKLIQQHYDDTSISFRRFAIHVIESNALEPLSEIGKFHAQNVLVLHGKSEKFISSSETESLVSAIPAEHKRFLDFDQCDHLELPSKDPQHFGEAMDLFLKQCKL